jgi:4-hydroxy-3-methylbut-2-en-1-yl diphosphate reductase
LLCGAKTLALTSAPESLVNEMSDALRDRFDLLVEERDGRREDVTFNVPRALAS